MNVNVWESRLEGLIIARNNDASRSAVGNFGLGVSTISDEIKAFEDQAPADPATKKLIDSIYAKVAFALEMKDEDVDPLELYRQKVKGYETNQSAQQQPPPTNRPGGAGSP